jgi:glycosyltransferase involved in cell wall biosynthesis
MNTAMEPKVSVRIITYNHEKYIGSALDSVLMQEVNFPYEIVIGEDCSTDNTRKILLEYKERHPDLIRLLLHEKNTGIHYNIRQTVATCRGRYMAMLDGDDYWTDPHKLQKQVDFLDNNPGCPLCFHSVEVRHEDGRPSRLYNQGRLDRFLNTADLLHTCLIHNSSKLVRADLLTTGRNGSRNFSLRIGRLMSWPPGMGTSDIWTK